MCASAAGAGPAVIKTEEFTLDPHTPSAADSEVSVLLHSRARGLVEDIQILKLNRVVLL